MNPHFGEPEPLLGAIDLALGDLINGLATRPHPWVRAAASVASRQTRAGHVCVPLDGVVLRPEWATACGLERWPSVLELATVLRDSGVAGDGQVPTPLVVGRGPSLYLYRYWVAERNVAMRLLERVSSGPRSELPSPAPAIVAELFGSQDAVTDWQRIAAVTALLGHLSVVVGGPGTGKTSTVVRLLALLQSVALAQAGAPLRVTLLAPTGKAAARLAESIQGAKAALGLPPAIADGIPETASTLHRAVFRRRGLDPLGRYEKPEPLFADVVVLDEASMVDLIALSGLLDAVPSSALVVLLGDDEQLTSVEAGSVLGDLTRRARGRGYSLERVRLLAHAGCGEVAADPAAMPLRDQIVELRRSYRFDVRSGVGALVSAVRAGDVERVVHVLESSEYPEVEWVPADEELPLDHRFDEAVFEGYGPVLSSASAVDALAAFGRFRVLAVHRRGRAGVEGLTARIEGVLSVRGLTLPDGDYAGKPLLVTENDYRVGLFNGDIGVLWHGSDRRLRAHFVTGDGVERAVAVPRLPRFETAYAMSVHKSQGSEFDTALCVLPRSGSPLLTREMLYTAFSRARRRILLFASRASIESAVARRVSRSSGLEGLLWGGQ